jgi:hypothetical protein
LNKELLIFFLYSLFFNFCYCKQDSVDHNYSSVTRIKKDLQQITKTKIARNYLHPEVLNKTAKYIFDEFSKCCDSVIYQIYLVDGTEYKNVVGSISAQNNERIIVGAHYDVCEEQEGADDNGSGIAGLLELARLLSKEKLSHRIDFVAYTLEEPPFFRTEEMGSHIHAKFLSDNNIPVIGMVCLEMIGYFSDKEDSQEYPLGLLKWFYGNRGDFITVVQKWGNGDFGDEFTDMMKQLNLIETKSFSGPTFLPGLDFSDHLNYWKFNYPAVMVTNTAFYRNKNYHQSSDRMETLDIGRMSLVIDELFLSLKELSSFDKKN